MAKAKTLHVPNNVN